jgi:RNA polymerase sigma factor (sigma-70 family)
VAEIENVLAQALPAQTAMPRLESATEFEKFFKDAYRTLRAAALYAGATWDEAEDAVATGMAEVWRRWNKIDNHLAYARLAVNHALVKEAVKHRRVIGDVTDPDELKCDRRGESDDDPRLSVWEDREWVMALLQSLPPAQRAVMACIVDEFTPAEVAELLGRTPTAVRQNLCAARQRLKQALAGQAMRG